MALNKTQVISIGLGVLFMLVALGLMGFEGIANLDKTPILLIFGVIILFAEVGMSNWTDGKWTAVEIMTIAVMLVVGLYAISLMFGMPIPADWLPAKLVPWAVLLQGIQIAWQGYKMK